MAQRTLARPWPAPAQAWALAMRWDNLLFMHWPVAAAAIRPHIPTSLELQTFQGTAWLGVVPFSMSNVRPRGLPSVPWLSQFPELNVRTYVTLGGKPGVWFFSLDASNPVAVRAARLSFHLPYYDARMRAHVRGDHVVYASRRTHRGAAHAEFVACYRPTGPPIPSQPDSLVTWLTARYCLYTADRRGAVWRGEINHQPWPLQPAEVELHRNTMAVPLGLALPATAPLLHFARRLDVVAWGPMRAS